MPTGKNSPAFCCMQPELIFVQTVTSCDNQAATEPICNGTPPTCACTAHAVLSINGWLSDYVGKISDHCLSLCCRFIVTLLAHSITSRSWRNYSQLKYRHKLAWCNRIASGVHVSDISLCLSICALVSMLFCMPF